MIRKLGCWLTKTLRFTPSFGIYIHLQNHNQKINPKQNKTHLSFMDPKNQTKLVPVQQKYQGFLEKEAQQLLDKKIFGVYKEKLLSGKIDEEETIQPDVLWGYDEVPVHYYSYLSNTQAARLSHSIIKDVEKYYHSLAQQYLTGIPKISSISQVTSINDLVLLAVNYRLDNQTSREKYYEVETKIGNKFHLLSDKQLILLKYAFMTSPKKGTPQFNKILNDLLVQALPKLETRDLVFLMFFNRFDHFHIKNVNLQIQLLRQLEHRYAKMTLQQKINFLFLYVESRSPTITPQCHNRFYNQIRNKTQQIIYLLNIDADLSNLSQQVILKLTFVLVRAKTNKTEHISSNIVSYVGKNIEKLSVNYIVLFFIYLTNIESGKSISDYELMKKLKQKIVASWTELTPINKLRCIDSMHTMKLYNEEIHQLYTSLPIEADTTMLAIFCRIEMMHSSSREWEVVHKLVQLDQLPFLYFQDYKRFLNYLTEIAPNWNLTPFGDKLFNIEAYYSSERLKSYSMDKHYYNEITKFQKFSMITAFPYPFLMGCPIQNVEFCEFVLQQYQISLDVITDVERIRGTKDLKGSFEIKIKSLENLGWKHIYVFIQDIEYLSPQQFFDYLYKQCEPHFEQQSKVVAAAIQKRGKKLNKLRAQKSLMQFDESQMEQLYSEIEKQKEMKKIQKEKNNEKIQ